MREFPDAAGVEWQVFEVRRASENDGAVTPGRERGWLAFSSTLERRRLAPFPADWESATDEGLATLCAAAEVVVQRHDEFIRERRRVPRLTRPAGNDALQRPRSETDTSQPSATPSEPAAEAPSVPEIDAIILQHAHRCRADGTTVVAGMMGLRRMLADKGISAGTDAFKNARRLFVSAFYFDE